MELLIPAARMVQYHRHVVKIQINTIPEEGRFKEGCSLGLWNSC